MGAQLLEQQARGRSIAILPGVHDCLSELFILVTTAAQRVLKEDPTLVAADRPTITATRAPESCPAGNPPNDT